MKRTISTAVGVALLGAGPATAQYFKPPTTMNPAFAPGGSQYNQLQLQQQQLKQSAATDPSRARERAEQAQRDAAAKAEAQRAEAEKKLKAQREKERAAGIEYHIYAHIDGKWVWQESSYYKADNAARAQVLGKNGPEIWTMVVEPNKPKPAFPAPRSAAPADVRPANGKAKLELWVWNFEKAAWEREDKYPSEEKAAEMAEIFKSSGYRVQLR